MADFYLFFSHTLTSDQIKEAKTVFNVDKIIELPIYLQKIWSNVPADKDINQNVDKFIGYLRKNSKVGDYILVEGDFGMTFSIVNWCITNNRIPVYATTERLAKSEGEGDFTKMTHYFKHIMFRQYKKYR